MCVASSWISSIYFTISQSTTIIDYISIFNNRFIETFTQEIPSQELNSYIQNIKIWFAHGYMYNVYDSIVWFKLKLKSLSKWVNFTWNSRKWTHYCVIRFRSYGFISCILHFSFHDLYYEFDISTRHNWQTSR